MTAAHKVCTARKSISVAKKRQQLTSKLLRKLLYIQVLI